MEVSVIIPARNAERWITAQLASLAAQTFRGSWEVIVADNGSVDATTRVARGWSDRLPDLRVVDAAAERGANGARNRGIAAAKGDLLLFCDADDCASPVWVERMAEARDRGDLLAGPLDLIRLNTARQRSWYGGDTSHPGVRHWDGFRSWAASANLGLSADLARAIGPFDTRIAGPGDDIAVCWRAGMLGTSPTEVPDAVMHYRLRPAGVPAWKHQYTYGRGMARLHRQFARYGLPRRSWRNAAMSWRHSLVECARSPLLSADDRRGALRELAYNAGRFVGSVEQRTMYF